MRKKRKRKNKIIIAGGKVHYPILLNLNISLVFITALGLAVVAHYMIRGITWFLAFNRAGIDITLDSEENRH